MTRDETKKLLLQMQMMYPNLKFTDLSFAIETWHQFLADRDYQLYADALAVYVQTDTSGFAPNLGQLNALIADASVESIEEGEIRAMLKRAAQNSNYGSVAEFNRLPEGLQKAVGSPSVIKSWGSQTWSDLDYEFSRIIKTYQRQVDAEKKNFKTPISLNVEERKMLNDTNGYRDASYEDFNSLPEFPLQ